MADPTVAQYLARALPRYGVSHIFELVGGMITVLLDAIQQDGTIRVVSMHHEQAAGFAAEGFARASGRPSVAMATSGPGATNLMTAIGSCYFDSSPVVFITGQVNRHELSHGAIGRQGGFQETDIVSIAGPLCKLAIQVEDPQRFPQLLDDAFRTATSGRPGPVLLDIPMDVQKLPVGPAPAPDALEQQDHDVSAFVRDLSESMKHCKRPLLLLGGGIRSSHGAVIAVRKLVAEWKIPTVLSLMGVDALPATARQRVGVIGSYGNRWANRAVAAADLLVVLGSRLDIRQTGSDVDGFRSGRRIFHADVDPLELGTRVPGCVTVQADVSEVLDALIDTALPTPVAPWLDQIKDWEREFPDTDENVPLDGGINPNRALREISAAWPEVASFITDVGQHQMWAAQSLQLAEHQRFITSGGMGAMGFGLPTAIGAALASTPAPVSLIAGDGGFQLNIQELQTIVRTRLPVRMVIFDNASHGMVRQFQESYFEGRYYSTLWGYSRPDFVALADAYGIQAFRADDHDQLADTLREVRGAVDPVLIRIPIDPRLNVYPKMAFGRAFGSMEPDCQPTAMEGT